MLDIEFSNSDLRFNRQLKKPDISFYSFYSLPNQNWAELKKLFSRFKPSGQIFVIGMGGSSLGTKTLVRGLCGKKTTFIDNIDPDFVSSKISDADQNSFFIIISKSGETIEIRAISNILVDKFKNPKQFVVITDNDKSYIHQWAKKNGIEAIVSDSGVPGRFSVLSKSGLFPVHLAGLDCKKILAGAREANENDAMELAYQQFTHYKGGKNIVVFFPYAEALNELGAWYVQLISESVGKSKQIGVTPLTAMGAKDQHSLLQLFLDGPDDKFYIFLRVRNFKNQLKIPGEKYSLSDLMSAEFAGVKKAFAEKKKPFAVITVGEINEKTFGELLFFFEMQIAFLGQLFGVNIESQPGVELSKKITKSFLENL